MFKSPTPKNPFAPITDAPPMKAAQPNRESTDLLREIRNIMWVLLILSALTTCSTCATSAAVNSTWTVRPTNR